MNTPLGIAATSLAFGNLLRKATPPNVEVTTLTLGEAEQFATQETMAARINLGLLCISPSSSIRNRMPDRQVPSAEGRHKQPPLKLDLRYIVTAYGAENPADECSSERLLGAALKAVYDHPILTSEELTAALDGMATTPFPGEASLMTETLTPSELTGFFTASRAALRPALPYLVTLTWR